MRDILASNSETKLATEYEAIRRREYELINTLLTVLPKVDSLSEERIAQVRDALFHADHPFLIVFVGPFSSGKSSLINALLGQEDLLTVGPVPTTDRISILRWGEEAQVMSSGSDVNTVFHPSALLKKVSFVDTPGLESVFKQHEDTTRKFLHRSDVVMLVMLATQAMTARNLEYLQTLKEYGKRVIVLINQADLLTVEEAETVRDYVIDQSASRLGYKPDVWLVSARKGLAAHSGGTLDKVAWEASGLVNVEMYVDRQLSDIARLRQKLQTPLQIIQNVNQVALSAVRSNQAALDHYQSINDNIQLQLSAARRDQDKIIRETNDQISTHFGEAAMRGSEVIQDVFRFSRAFGSVGRGVLELVGLAGLFKRARGASYTRLALERKKAFEPLAEIPAVVDRLGPRLEGKDVQDIDDLVKYARREIDALPSAMRDKVIGSIHVPLSYDRVALQQIRPDLERIEDEARTIETDKLDQALSNTLIFLAVWELLLVIFGVAFIAGFDTITGLDKPEQTILVLIVLMALGLAGLAIMPLRGRMLESTYTNRLLKLQNRYIETLSKAADKQVAYGMQIRTDAIAPLTRLVAAQTELQTEQLNKLQAAEQEMVGIEAALTSMGNRGILGLRS